MLVVLHVPALSSVHMDKRCILPPAPHLHTHCFTYSSTVFMFGVPQAVQSPCCLVYGAGIQSMAPFFDQHPICELFPTHQWILQSIEFNRTFHHLDFYLCEGVCACDVWCWGGMKECSLALIDTSPSLPRPPFSSL